MRQLAGERLELRAGLLWKRKSSKLTWPQPPVCLIDDADEDLLALDLAADRRSRAAGFPGSCRGAVEDAVVVGRDEIDARLPAAAAADEEAGDRGA